MVPDGAKERCRTHNHTHTRGRMDGWTHRQTHKHGHTNTDTHVREAILLRWCSHGGVLYVSFLRGLFLGWWAAFKTFQAVEVGAWVGGHGLARIGGGVL